MIGGEEEDDLDELLEVIGSQQAGLVPSEVGHVDRRREQSLGSFQTPPMNVMSAPEGRESLMGNTIMLLLQQQADQNRQNSEMIKLLMEEKEGTAGRGGKRRNDDNSLQPQEPVLFAVDAYKINDDGHEILDTSLRQKL